MTELTEICKKYCLTQKRLSELTGIPKRTIESWYEGIRTPPAYIPKLIDAYLSQISDMPPKG